MQVLFTCVPGHGHLNPMAPLAHELVGRGCDTHGLGPRTLGTFSNTDVGTWMDPHLLRP